MDGGYNRYSVKLALALERRGMIPIYPIRSCASIFRPCLCVDRSRRPGCMNRGLFPIQQDPYRDRKRMASKLL